MYTVQYTSTVQCTSYSEQNFQSCLVILLLPGAQVFVELLRPVDYCRLAVGIQIRKVKYCI